MLWGWSVGILNCLDANSTPVTGDTAKLLGHHATACSVPVKAHGNFLVGLGRCRTKGAFGVGTVFAVSGTGPMVMFPGRIRRYQAMTKWARPLNAQFFCTQIWQFWTAVTACVCGAGEDNLQPGFSALQFLQVTIVHFRYGVRCLIPHVAVRWRAVPCRAAA